MTRLACVDVRALPLQLLLRTHPEWREHPVAVVAEDKPTATILQVNARAARVRVLPGMRYAAGLSIARELRAAVVGEADITAEVESMTTLLRRFSPRIEPSSNEPGVFWVDAAGLGGLFASLDDWALQVRESLQRPEPDGPGLHSTIGVGFTRFGSYAGARSRRQGHVVYDTPATERAGAEAVPIELLGLHPTASGALYELGVRTVGGFLALPARGIARRFGEEAQRLHRLATGDLFSMLAPIPEIMPIANQRLLDFPVKDATRILFLIKRDLPPLLGMLAAREERLQALTLRMVLDPRGRRRLGEPDPEDTRLEAIRPAAPTLDEKQLLDLVRLRLEALALPSGVIELAMSVQGVSASYRQPGLWTAKPRRDLEAAERALARLRTEWGDDAVTRARLVDGHLPEARYRLEPLSVPLPHPQPGLVAIRPLVRRIFPRPTPLPAWPRKHDDGWLVAGAEAGAATRVLGPFVVSGGWWRREVHRSYHLVETKRGDLLWTFEDRERGRWFLQGRVE